MSDEVDAAQQHTDLLTSAGIERVRSQLNHRNANREPWCEDCGGEIDLRRRECRPGVKTCLECQYRREMNGRHQRQE